MNSELTKRVLVALIGIPLSIYLIYLGGLSFVLTITIISGLGLWEFYNMMNVKGFKPVLYAGLLFNVITTMFAGIMIVDNQFMMSTLFLIGVTLSFTLLMLLLQLWDTTKTPIENTFVTIFGLLYVGIFFICILYIRNFDVIVAYLYKIMPLQINSNLLVSVIWWKFLLIYFSSIWVCDSAAYFVGKSLGKTKLFERHSPKKTREGALGGLIFSVIYFTLMLKYFIPEIHFFNGISLGLIVGVFGQLGDLIESQYKRYAGVKDSSHIIPGHGGILDRFDSILFTAPFVLFYLFFLTFF